MKFSGLAFMALVATCELDGQDSTGVTCTARVEAPRDIDANTATGLVGDVLLLCSGGTPTPAGAPVPLAEFIISTDPNIAITSRLLNEPGHNTLSEALLFFDDPTPVKQTLCLPQGTSDTCPGSHLGSGNGRGTYDPDSNSGGPRRGNAWLGSISVGLGLTYPRIPFDPPGPGAERILRFTGIRVNAAESVVQSGKQAALGLKLSALFAAGLQQIFQFKVNAARIFGNSINFSIQNPLTLYQCEPANPGLATNPNLADVVKTITANFSEEYGRYFGPEINILKPSGANEFHGEFYDFTGFYRPRSDPRWPRNIGREDSGTELTFQFANVPNGVDLWAEREVTSGAARAVLFTTVPSTNRWVQIPVENGFANLAWHVLSSDYRQLETLSPKVAVSYTGGRPALGIAGVTGYGGPVSTFPERRVPRFFASYPEDRARNGIAAFEINDCANRDTVRQSFAVTTGLFPIGVNSGGIAPERGKFYVRSSGKQNTGIRLEGPTSAWLRAKLDTNLTPATIDLSVDSDWAAALAPGNHSTTFRILSDLANPATVTVPLVVNALSPHLPRWGIANTASYESEAIAPGEALTFFGERFGPDTLATAQLVDGKFSSEIGGTRVLFDGVPGPMIYASRGQVSVIAPFGLAGKTGTLIQVEYQGVRSPAVRVPVVDAVPGLLTADASGSGKAAALNQDNSFNSVTGALPGEYVSFFGVGGPSTDPPGRDGELYPLVLGEHKLKVPVAVLLDGVQVPDGDILYVGPAPGLVQGVWTGIFRLSENAPRNEEMQVQFRFGDYFTQPGVTVSVR